MSHRDRDGLIASGGYVQELSAAVHWLLSGVEWKGIALRRDCGWAVRGLVTAALLWAWSSEAALMERFDRARQVARRLCGKGAPQSSSYQAFIKLLVRWTVGLFGAGPEVSDGAGVSRFVSDRRLRGAGGRRHQGGSAAHGVERGAVFSGQDTGSRSEAEEAETSRPTVAIAEGPAAPGS